MGSNLVVDLLVRFRLYGYKKRFERLKPQYIACIYDDELEKITAKFNVLQNHLDSLGESGQPLQEEITRFFEQNFKIVVRRTPIHVDKKIFDLITNREREKNTSPSTARKKNIPPDIKYVK